jgi:hydrogenase nickel incorporation protein HypA/HybF
MHELMLVQGLLAQVETLVEQHGGGQLRRLVVRVGTLSGVEPQLLAEAFQQLRCDWRWPAAELEVQEEPLRLECCLCQHVFEPLDFVCVCPACGSGQSRELAGNRVILDHLTLDQD